MEAAVWSGWQRAPRLSAFRLRALRLIALAYLAATVLMTIIGLNSVASDAPFDAAPVALVPVAVAVFGVVMVRVLKRSPALAQPVDAAAVGRLAQAMLFGRVGFAAAPALWGFALGFAVPSKTPLLVGLGCTLVLFALWWPGERFVQAVRGRVEPTGAAHLVDEVLRGRDPGI